MFWSFPKQCAAQAHENDRSLKQLDLSANRRAHRWRVEETGECLFLIDVDLPDPNTTDMQHLLEIADQTSVSVLP